MTKTKQQDDTSAEQSREIRELSRRVVAALEPMPPASPRPPLQQPIHCSPKGMWYWADDWFEMPLCSPSIWPDAEALLRQDPARKERYAEELVREIGGNKSFSSGIVDLALFEVFDIATATDEERLRAAARALGVG